MARVRILFVPLLLAGCSSVLACGKRVERAPTTNTTRGVEPPPSTDRTYDLRWSPSRVGACSPEANVSPALAHAGAVAAEVGQVMLEPAVAFLDETLTFVQRNEVGEASIEMPWHGLVVEGQGAAPRLYDDGTHGDGCSRPTRPPPPPTTSS